MRYAVKYCVAGVWLRWGIPFGTMGGAIACAARIQVSEGYPTRIEEVR